MNIGIFLQNQKRGGLDTFIIQLIKNWPYKQDRIYIYCNHSHPGVNYLRNKLGDNIIIYNLILYEDLKTKTKNFPHFLTLVLKFLFLVFGYFYQLYKMKNLFKDTKIDKMLIVNGGYPAGDACIIATIAWGELYPQNKAWHNFHNFASPIPANTILSIYESWIDKKIANTSAGFISVSKYCIDTLNLRPDLKNVKKDFIYNGMEELKPILNKSIRKELGLKDKSKLVLMLGTYEERKGHKFIIEVMESVLKSLSDTHILICGDGTPKERKIVDILKNNSSARDNIHLMGHRDDIENLLAQIDILVAPSQDYESFGYMALEAMCCKKPVVVTDVGGLPEVVLNGKCGYVINKNDRAGFAKAMLKLLTEKDLRANFGIEGYQRYKELFSARLMAKNYADLIRA